jgi:16S rRNA (cytosine967-C5)-methyltransferase
LIQELAYGTLRWYHQLAGIARVFVARPFKRKDADVHALLLAGLYQLRHLRVPDYAAVDATVAAADLLEKGWAKGVINASLRAYLREGARADTAIAASEELRYSHPAWLIAAIRRDHPNDWTRILDANNERPPMTVRVNTARATRADCLELFRQNDIAAHPHATVATAIVLDRPVAVDRIPRFTDGWVSVQDAAAQLAAGWLHAQPGQRVLDACAAPGGKAMHVLERTPALGELVALDIDVRRLERLQSNLRRIGAHARTSVADATEARQWWDGVPFDRILVDAPCSATGVIRRHPDIKVRRQPEELTKLERTQARILEGVWPCLARGGKLLYVTCSLLSAENEDQIRTFAMRRSDVVVEPLDGESGIGRQILPGSEMDGFYYARLRKS